jgi:S1-C subfamily serine protease
MPRTLRSARLLAGAALAALCLHASFLPAAAAQGAADAVSASVVKVFSTIRQPDFYRPWGKQPPVQITGSGVVIEGRRILTNAHVVLYASQVEVEGSQAGDKIPAQVVAIAPGIDLAVLKLDDESFFDTRPPLARADTLPSVKDPVVVYGFPTGGASLSITKGIVSRIEFVSYNYPVSGLRIQLDAAINPGNSGGPAVAGDRMIGLAFSHLGNAENIGYIIPSEEIELFLQGVARGHYDGKPGLHAELQTLENPGLRSFLKLDKSVAGMVVRRVENEVPDYPLKAWDVVTQIGDTPIDDQGTIKVSDQLRLTFTYLVQKLARDGKVPLTVVRAGKVKHILLPVPSTRPMLLGDLAGAYPPYFICGPLAFTAATAAFVSGISANNPYLNYLGAIGSPLVLRRGDRPAFPGEQLVVVPAPFFPHALSENYSNPVFHVVRSINGVPIRNLGQLVETLRDCRDPFITVDFCERDTEELVFPRRAMFDATEDILTDNGVRAQGSPELLALWQAKPTAP